jgi:alkaline phosphatase
MKTVLRFSKQILILFFLATFLLNAQERKNVIILIPDGTSIPVLTLARWYQGYINNSIKQLPPLAVDPYICGLVRSHSSDAPIGDSAPTGSWYACGESSRASYISMYAPVNIENDIVELDNTKSYQPLMTVLEAAKLSGMSTGIVVTCQFTHATPADFTAHWYDRGNDYILADQIIYNNIDVVFGGGVKYLSKENEEYLLSQKYKILKNDLNGFRNIIESASTKSFALFNDVDLNYDFDRAENKEPSLEEMTEKALNILSKNANGFFLMVEGSKIDWANHANDPIAAISDYLAFDKAVQKAIDFAQNFKERETVVIVVPDHGTGGITFGSSRIPNYSTFSLKQFYEPIVQWKKTSVGIAEGLAKDFKADPSFIQEEFNKSNPTIKLTDEEIAEFITAYETKDDKSLAGKFASIIVKIINSRSFVGYTTHGHTGEDLFLAIYDKNKEHPTGVVRSEVINKYMCKSLGLVDKAGNATLSDSTYKYFAKHFEVFENCEVSLIKNDSIYTWDNNKKTFVKPKLVNTKKFSEALGNSNNNRKPNYSLIVNKGKYSLEIPAYKNYYYLNGKKQQLNSVTIYVDKNSTFYLPKELASSR